MKGSFGVTLLRSETPPKHVTVQAKFNPSLRVEISGEEESCAARVPGLRAGDVQPDPDRPALHRADPRCSVQGPHR